LYGNLFCLDSYQIGYYNNILVKIAANNWGYGTYFRTH
jgi:hypothetical protein